jgi:hypothetical protein
VTKVRDPKTLSGIEWNALINAGWDGKTPLPHLTEEELIQLLNKQREALDRMTGVSRT